MCDGIGTDIVGVASYGNGLKDAFRTDGNGVTVVAHHVSEDHIFETFLVILLCNVERNIVLCPQFVGICFVGLELFVAETARVGTCGIDFPAFLTEFHHGV